MATVYVNSLQKPKLIEMLERPEVTRIEIGSIPNLHSASTLMIRLTITGHGPRCGPKNERKVPHIEYEEYRIGPRGRVELANPPRKRGRRASRAS